VGGNVQATKLVYRVPPAYPEHAKQNGLQGVVVLQAVIGINGSLLSIQPLSKSVDAELVQAAQDAVSQWRYEPVLLNGHPVEAVTTITVNFRLE
jgi:TonB family protein